jgi:xeroderma pigmentosum group C-complementing protein
VVQVYWEAEHVAAQQEQEKRRQAVLKRWTKLVHGLRIRQRLREEYGSPTGSNRRGLASTSAAVDNTKHDQDAARGGGGFLTGVEDVVQPYSLPRPTHVVFSSPPRSPHSNGRSSPSPLPMTIPAPAAPDVLLNNSANDGDDEEGSQSPTPAFFSGSPRSHSPPAAGDRNNSRRKGMPKSMAELAAELAAAEPGAEVEVAPPPPQMNEGATTSFDSFSASSSRAAPKAKARARPRPRPKSKMAQSQSQSQTHLRGRKRARGGDASDVESVNDKDWDKNGDEDGDGEKPRVVKRTRTWVQKRQREGLGAGVGVVPASDRVLRARKGKSAEQVAHEREMVG